MKFAKIGTVCAACAFLGIFLDVKVPLGVANLGVFDFMMLPFLACMLMSKAKPVIASDDVVIWFFLIMTGYFFCHSILLSFAPDYVIKESIQVAEHVVYYIYCRRLFMDGKCLKLFFKCALIGMILIAFYNTFAHVSQGQLYNYKSIGPMKLTYGVVGLWITLMIIYQVRKGFAGSIVIWLMAIVFAGQIILSGERKGWIGFGLGLLVVLLVFVPRRSGDVSIFRIKALAFLGGFSVFVVVGVLSLSTMIPALDKQVSSIADIFASIEGGRIYAESAGTLSNRGRLMMMDQAITSFQAAPLIGNAYPTSLSYNMHGRLFSIMIDYGSIGIIIYLSFFLVLLGRFFKVGPTVMPEFSAIFGCGGGLLIYGFVMSQFLAEGVAQNIFLLLPAALMAGVRDANRQVNRSSHVNPVRGRAPLRAYSV